MAARLIAFAASLLVVIPILAIAGRAAADELPDGIKVTVIAEYQSRVPSVDKVRYVKVVLEPGAKFDNIMVVHEEYCRLTQGQLTHTNHATGITDVFTVGSLWAPPKGDRHTVTNTGEVDAVMWVYQLVETGSGEEKKM